MREVLRREWLVASRSLGQLGRTLLFMLLVVTLFPLALSPARQVLEQVGLGALWIVKIPGNERLLVFVPFLLLQLVYTWRVRRKAAKAGVRW